VEGCRFFPLLALAALLAPPVDALDREKLLTQYSRSLWTQQHGLPQDSVHGIAQTSDGYLWIGTAEGLARFDGYEFVSYDRDRGGLPSNSITALTATPDGSLWIGTPSGLVLHKGSTFRTFTTRDGLPDNAISAVRLDPSGNLWIAAGLFLSRYRDGRFQNFAPSEQLPLRSVRDVAIDRHGAVWVTGLGGVARWKGGHFEHIMRAEALGSSLPHKLLIDRQDRVWLAGSQGLVMRDPAGAIRRYGTAQGLPDYQVRTVLEDSDGNVWAGTYGGLARLKGDRFESLADARSRERALVFSLLEDRERNLWVGTNGGLMRFRDDIFTVYGVPEGLPSDVPNSVLEDRDGRIWIGFQNSGLMLFSGGERRVYTVADGLPTNEILSLRQSRNGDLLLGTQAGLAWMSGNRFRTYRPPDPLSRTAVNDALEDRQGRLWLATPSGLGKLEQGRFHVEIPGAALISAAFGVIAEGRDGSIWAGTLGRGLWRWRNGRTEHFTTDHGLGSNGIRSIYEDSSGVLWVGTFGGGLSVRVQDRFVSITTKAGLLSNNVLHITDDGKQLWLSTTRGICSVSKQQLLNFAAGRTSNLTPENFGVQDGLRSAQSGPSHPVAGGGTRTSDGRLWFPTSQGLAVLAPPFRRPLRTPPPVHIQEIRVSENGRVQVRFHAIHLRAPEQVEYSYTLDGVDADWVPSGNRRVIDYSAVSPGKYPLHVRASLPGGVTSERIEMLEVKPLYYQTFWFRALMAAVAAGLILMIYRMRINHVRDRFQLVLNERARLAREIHDTLAQGFSGIASQLDAVALCMSSDPDSARRHLELARKMARHSMTEARRAVMDLRSSVLEGRDLAEALKVGALAWAAPAGVPVELDVSSPQKQLPQEMEQNLLRIAQEAVTNAAKHARASRVCVKLHSDQQNLYLRVADDGKGFNVSDGLNAFEGHFGLVGMQERTQRMRGLFRVESEPDEGTLIEVMVPLP
jgi:signal transduction histidine kinase/ligand-binding sensor domain-containing protein